MPHQQHTINVVSLVTAICTILWFAVYTWLHHYTFADDAFIFFRYADNIVAGNGPVFNHGERVEGFTSPLWLGILTLCQLLDINILHAATIIGMLLGIGAILLVLTFPGLNSSPVLRAIASATICVQPWFMFWVTSGMETMLFTFLALFAVHVYLSEKQTDKSHFISGGLIALTILTRPEGVFLAPLLFLGMPNSKKKGFLEGLLPLILAYQIFRMTYFNSLVPNTATAKIMLDSNHLEMGRRYVLQFFANVPISLVGFLPAIFAFFPRIHNCNHEQKLIRTLHVTLLIFIVYFLTIGGDFFQYHRFFVPLFPWFVLLSTYAIHHLIALVRTNRMKWIVYIATATIFLLLLIPSLNQSLVRRQYGIDWIVASGKLGNALRLQYPENTLIAAPHIGALGYYSKLPMLDMLGLTDKHIANSTPNPEVYREYPQKDVGHERFDIEYALSRKPRIFVPINGFTSVPATHISEVPVRFAMEHVLINRMNSHPEYQLTNIPVENNFYWIVLEKKHIRNPL